MEFYNGQFWGMHFIWWIIWIIFLIWIFFIPFGRPGQNLKKEGPLDILKKRFAKGEISREEYEESRKLLNSDNQP